jgi:sec-independent protein translocase protein TatB
MFGLDFFELVVIFVVALVVLGPTRLPGVARKVGRWMGKARGMARDFRQQLENEVTLDELTKMTEQQSRATQAAAAAAAATAGSAAATESASSPGVDAAAPAAGPPPPPPSAATADGAPQPGDDTYSHAHADGEAPQPWSPEAELAHDLAAHADPAPAGEAPALEPAGADAGKPHP